MYKMVKLTHGNSLLNTKLTELKSLKNESNKIISKHAKSRKTLDSLINDSDVLKNNSKVVGEKLLLLEDGLLPARNEIHAVKKRHVYLIKNHCW